MDVLFLGIWGQNHWKVGEVVQILLVDKRHVNVLVSSLITRIYRWLFPCSRANFKIPFAWWMPCQMSCSPETIMRCRLKTFHDHHLSWCESEQEKQYSSWSMHRFQYAWESKYHTVKYYSSTGNNQGFSWKPWALQLEDKGQTGDWETLTERVKVELKTYKVYFKCSSISMIAAWLPHL